MMITLMLAAAVGIAGIENEIAAMEARVGAMERDCRGEIAVTEFRGLVRTENGTNIWTAAIDAALRDGARTVRIPASDEPYYVDATLVVPSGRKLVAEGAVVRLMPPCDTVFLRNAGAADGTLAPVDRAQGDRGIFIVGGRWEDWQSAKVGYGKSGRFADGPREPGKNFHGVSALFYFGNVDGLVVRDVTIASAGAFAIQCGDTRDAVFENIEFDGCFADGLHLNGGIERIHARNLRGDVGDDLVALNVYDWQDSSVNFGPGDTILCEDLYLRRGYPAIRLLPGVYRYADGTKRDCALRNVVLRNVRGVTCFKMYLQTPAYEVGSDHEWGEVGSAENLWFDNIDIDLDFPPDRFDAYLKGDPLRGHFGAFEIGANVKGLHLSRIRANLHPEVYPLAHLVTVGPKSCIEKTPAGRPLEIFDPWVSCRVEGISIDGFEPVGKPPAELVHATAFEDINRDGRSTGRGEVSGVAVTERRRTKRELFNGRDLTGWYKYLRGQGRDHDPNGVISVTNGVIRITGETWGALVSEEEFSDYRLDVEYRFLGTRFGDKAKKALDSGILFHSTGPDGAFYDTWLYSHEYNLITGASGEIWTVGDVKQRPDMVVVAEKGGMFTDETMPDPWRHHAIWKEGGERIELRGNRRLCRCDMAPGWTDSPAAPLAANERPTGEWNTATLICRGETVECIFNGKTVTKAVRVVPSRGRLQLQSEGCGVEFRRVTLTPLESGGGRDRTERSGRAGFRSLAGDYQVTGKDLAGEVKLPGTLADAKLGKHYTLAEYGKFGAGSRLAGCLTREYQYLGKAAYTRKLTLTEADCRVPLEIFLERVMWKSEVFLDGVSLGSEDILSVPHVHPVPAALATPGEHELRIEVDNSNQYRFTAFSHSYGPQMQSIWHGVLGRMELRERNALRDVRIFAEPGRRVFTFEAPAAFEANAETVRVEGETVRVSRRDAKTVEVELARMPESWNEFHPRLYCLVLTDPETGLVVRHRFGFRSLAAKDHALYINGVRSFIRGNVENCNFALNGSPAMTKEEWLAVMRKLKYEDGINAYRFHTWTPPEAAFEAADELGMYMLAEADIWVDYHGDWKLDQTLEDSTRPSPLGYGNPIDGYAQRALRAISDAYGNSPSFCSLAVGNELGGAKWASLEQWIATAKAHDPRRLYFASTAREITAADDYMVTHMYPGIGMVREVFRPTTDWDYEERYSKTAIPTMAHEIGQWPVYPMWDFLAKFTGHLRPYNLDRWRRLAEERNAIRFNRRYHDASAKQSRLIYKDEVESFLRTPSCAGVQLLNVQDFTGQGEALVGWRDPFYDLKPGFGELPRFNTIWNATNYLARIGKWTWRRGEEFRARLQVRNLAETAIAAGTAFDCTLDGRACTARLAETLGPGGLGEAGTVTLKLDDSVAVGPHDLRFGTNRWRFWVYPAESAPAVPAGITVTDDPKLAAERLAAGATVVYTGTSQGGEKDTFRSCYWVGNKTWAWIPPLSATLGTCVDERHPALAGFPTEDWSDWQWYSLVEGANLHRLDGMVPDSFRPITMSVNDFHFSYLSSSFFEAKVGPGRLVVCGYRMDGDSPAQIRFRASLFDYLKSGREPALTEFPASWFARLFYRD